MMRWLALSVLLIGCNDKGFHNRIDLVEAYCSESISYDEFRQKLADSNRHRIGIADVASLAKVDCDGFNKAINRSWMSHDGCYITFDADGKPQTH
jgi:hypothetical protein